MHDFNEGARAQDSPQVVAQVVDLQHQGAAASENPRHLVESDPDVHVGEGEPAEHDVEGGAGEGKRFSGADEQRRRPRAEQRSSLDQPATPDIDSYGYGVE